MAIKRKMPSKSNIVDYWNDNIEKLGVYQTAQDEVFPEDCFACGKMGNVERCHVFSKWQGGEDRVENIVLLCRGCHTESEDLCPDAFWVWINNCRKEKWKHWYAHILGKLELLGYSLDKIKQMLENRNPHDVFNEILGAWTGSREKVNGK